MYLSSFARSILREWTDQVSVVGVELCKFLLQRQTRILRSTSIDSEVETFLRLKLFHREIRKNVSILWSLTGDVKT